MNNFLSKIYNNVPVIFQNSLINLHGFKVQRTRFNSQFKKYLEEAKIRELSPIEERLKYRNKLTIDFINYSLSRNEFYKSFYKENKVKIKKIESICQISELPILTKSIVQKHIAKIINLENVKFHINIHTSGTTGGGLIFPTTNEAIRRQWAIWWRFRNNHGIKSNIWCGYFGGRTIVPITQHMPPYHRCNYPGKQILFSAYHINEKNIPIYIDTLNRYELKWLHGYPSIINLLAKYLNESNRKLNYEVQFITTGAENLTLNQIDSITKAFGVKPITHYGMAEAVANFSENSDGKFLVDEDFSYTEFIETGVGDTYEVVGTNFTNYAFPLIRYQVGDHVELAVNDINSQRQVLKIDGRSEDYILLDDGTKLGRLDHIFKDMINVVEAQFYQNINGFVEIRIVKGKNFSDLDERNLKSEVYSRIGNNLKFEILYVPKIEKSQSGKLRFVISEIGKI